MLTARGAGCQVETPDGRIECVLRGILKKEKQVTVDPVAVGDWVEVEVGADGRGAVETIEPRATKFSRPAPGRPHLEQVIVANAHQMVIVQAAREPVVKVTSIDRYLVAAAVGGLRPVLCINKMDLDKDGSARRATAVYRELGFDLRYTTAIEGEGVAELKRALVGQVSVLVGPSGTGKSTLLNGVEPGLGLRVREVSRKWSKGKHTTSWVELFPLQEGGWVADTPGLREIGLWDVEAASLAGYFHEFESYAEGCRFATCTHSHEPECGVVDAVERGRIHRARYDSYLRILESLSGRD